MYYLIGFILIVLMYKGAWVLVLPIVGIAVAVSYFNHLKQSAKNRETSAAEHQEWLKSEQERLKKEEDTFSQLVSKHLRELTTRKRQLIVRGAYGVVNEERWNEEVQEFLENVYLPSVQGRSQTSLNVLSAKVKAIVSEFENSQPESTFSDEISPIDYEHYCSEVLSRNGWDSRVTIATGDQGADIVATMAGIKVVIQCKKYSGSVGNKAVQEVHAAKGHYDADEAVVVTNAQYTTSARALANSLGVHLLHHGDLDRLSEILKLN